MKLQVNVNYIVSDVISLIFKFASDLSLRSDLRLYLICVFLLVAFDSSLHDLSHNQGHVNYEYECEFLKASNKLTI